MWKILKNTAKLALTIPGLWVMAVVSQFTFGANSGHTAGLGAGMMLLFFLGSVVAVAGLVGAGLFLQSSGIPFFISIPALYLAGAYG
jgi:hypothetical protein